MKRIILGALIESMTISADTQPMRNEELEEYAKEKSDDKWVDTAANMDPQPALDRNGSLTYTQVIKCGERTKEKLYVVLNH